MAYLQSMKKRWPIMAGMAVFIAASACMNAFGGLFLPPLALALCVLGVWLPGRVLAEAVGAKRFGLLQTASFVFGMLAFAACSALASAWGAFWLPWLLAAAGLAGLWVKRRPLLAALRAPDRPGEGWLCAAVLCLLALYCVGGALRFALPAVAGGAVAPQQDFFWNVGNAQSFLLGFPPQDLRFSGYTLTYHYLSELMAAGLSMASGTPCYDLEAVLLPLAGILFTAAMLWDLGRILYGGSIKRAGLLLGLVFLCGGAGLWKVFEYGRCPFWNLSVYHVLTNINGMGFGLGLLAAFFSTGAVLFRREGNARPAWLWGLNLAALALLCFAKGPVAGVAVLAFFCAALVRLPGAGRGGMRLRAATLAWALMLLAGFGALYAAFFSAGAGTSIHFSVFGTLEKSYFANFIALIRAKWPALLGAAAPVFMLAQAVCYAPAAMPLALLGGVRDALRIFRLPGERLMLYAGLLGGFAAFFLFDHEAMSQMYFAFLGLLCADALAVQSLPGFLAFCARRKRAASLACRGAVAALALAGLATGLCTMAQMVRETVPVMTRAAADDSWDLPLTAAEQQAMEWVRQNVPETALLATNRTHTGKALEGLSNVYSGLSGRRFYMESFKYARSNLGVPEEEIALRVDEMKALFGPGIEAREAAAFCREKGISHVVYSAQAARYGWDITEQAQPGIFGGPSAPEGFETVYENGDVTIFKVMQ